jgi:hypothetical protein
LPRSSINARASSSSNPDGTPPIGPSPTISGSTWHSRRADLDAYGPHPAHQEVVTRLREIADWVICDYEIAE